jgi:hypothetical protein
MVTVGYCATVMMSLALMQPRWPARAYQTWSRDLPFLEVFEPVSREARLKEVRVARLVAKREITRQLIARRLTLPEAVNRFERVHQRGPVEQVDSSLFVGRSLRERQCRQLLAWVEGELRMLAQPPEELLQLLEAEMHAYLQMQIEAHRAAGYRSRAA